MLEKIDQLNFPEEYESYYFNVLREALGQLRIDTEYYAKNFNLFLSNIIEVIKEDFKKSDSKFEKLYNSDKVAVIPIDKYSHRINLKKTSDSLRNQYGFYQGTSKNKRSKDVLRTVRFFYEFTMLLKMALDDSKYIEKLKIEDVEAYRSAITQLEEELMEKLQNGTVEEASQSVPSIAVYHAEDLFQFLLTTLDEESIELFSEDAFYPDCPKEYFIANSPIETFRFRSTSGVRFGAAAVRLINGSYLFATASGEPIQNEMDDDPFESNTHVVLLEDRDAFADYFEEYLDEIQPQLFEVNHEDYTTVALMGEKLEVLLG